MSLKEREKRALLRRQTWQGAKSASHEEMEQQDLLFWQQAVGSTRLEATWQMAWEAWTMKRGNEPAPRLQGSPVGIRRRRG